MKFDVVRSELLPDSLFEAIPCGETTLATSKVFGVVCFEVLELHIHADDIPQRVLTLNAHLTEPLAQQRAQFRDLRTRFL